MSRRRTRANPDQLGLSLVGEGFEGSLETRGVFSLAYLPRHLKLAPEFASEQDCAGAFREIGEIWQRHLTALSDWLARDLSGCLRTTTLQMLRDTQFPGQIRNRVQCVHSVVLPAFARGEALSCLHHFSEPDPEGGLSAGTSNLRLLSSIGSSGR